MHGNRAGAALTSAYRARYPTDGYLAYHAPRYALLLDLLARYVGPATRVLDIGCSRLTDMIRQHLGVPVDTLGLWPESDAPTATGQHYRYDLNDTQDRGSWRRIGPYDVIVMAEVIEHIHTAPTRVLAYVRSLLENSGVLILQTPNAAALHKRLELLLGRNPYELIREDTTDPGHFREYTRGELRRLAEQTGFTVEACRMGNYFDYRFSRHSHTTLVNSGWRRTVNLGYAILPPSVQPGITLVLRCGSE